MSSFQSSSEGASFFKESASLLVPGALLMSAILDAMTVAAPSAPFGASAPFCVDATSKSAVELEASESRLRDGGSVLGGIGVALELFPVEAGVGEFYEE